MADPNVFPRLTPIVPEIRRELNRRKNEMFGEKNAPRAIWVRAVSNATKSDTTRIRSDLNIMCGGLLKRSKIRGGFEPVYNRPGRRIQDRPIPGIESVSIANKGRMGSLRKVTITWACPSVEDLDYLTPFWLTPGISVLLEWGWSRVGETIIPYNADDLNLLTELYTDPFKIYRDRVLKTNGNQDGFIGLITNYNFTANDDGSYSCTTELTAMGETMLALNLNKEKRYKSDVTRANEDKKKETILEFINNNLLSENIESYTHPTTGKKYVDTKDVFIAKKSSPEFSFMKEDRVFVTWNFIENEIVNRHAAPIFGRQDIPVYQLNSDGQQISNDEYLYSTDIEVMLLYKHGQLLKRFGTYYDENGQAQGGTSETYGYISNIYLNGKFVKEVIENSETLEEALNKLLNKMSFTAVQLWDFRIYVDPKKETVAKVIDSNLTDEDDLKNIEPNNVFSFGGYGGTSIINSVNYTSKMTNQLALTHFFARNKGQEDADVTLSDDSDVASEMMFQGVNDRILRNLRMPQTTPEKIRNQDAKKIAEEEKEEDYTKGFSEEDVKNKILGEGITDSGQIIVFDDQARKFLGEWFRRQNASNLTQQIVLFPLEVEVGIDGISGLLPGYVFQLDNTPGIYRRNGVFQILEINHNITDDDWQTNVRAVFIYNPPKPSELGQSIEVKRKGSIDRALRELTDEEGE